MIAVLTLCYIVCLATADPQERSDASITPSCKQDSDCYPQGLTTIPTTLVDCLDDGTCTCSQCFTHNATTNKCFFEYPNCYYYDPNTDSCVDTRKSQLVALLLSLSLSGVGAANYYIGQTFLASIQLTMLLLVFLGIGGYLGLFFCSVSTLEFKSEKTTKSLVSACTMISAIISGVLTLLPVLGIGIWWIVDAYIFITNRRLGGNDCPLRPIL